MQLAELANANQNVKITREGIVQAFKDTCKPKISKYLSIQVKKILDERLDPKFVKVMIDKEDLSYSNDVLHLEDIRLDCRSGKL